MLQVSAGGVVRDPAVHQEVIARVVAACQVGGRRRASYWAAADGASHLETLSYRQG